MMHAVWQFTFLAEVVSELGRLSAERSEPRRRQPTIRPHNLPPLPSNTVPRHEYLHQILSLAPKPQQHPSEALEIHVAILLSGMPGVGKTSLAIAAAEELSTEFPDGSLYINLNGFSDSEAPLAPDSALDSLLRQMGVPNADIPLTQSDKSLMWRTVIDSFCGLVVLDNARNAHQITPLLPSKTLCCILVTSRNRMPELRSVHKLPIDILKVSEACTFFESHFPFRAERPDENLALEHCVRACGLLPLTLRIVASLWATRANTYSEIWHWSEASKSDEWTFRNADSDAEFAFNASYRLLNQTAQRAFLVSCALPGTDFTPERLSASLELSTSPFGDLFYLVDYSLVIEPTKDRFSIHDLLKLFGRRRFAAENPEDLKRVPVKSLQWYVAYASTSIAEFESGHIGKAVLRTWVSQEMRNIIANCEACLNANAALVLNLIGLISPYCLRFGMNTGAYLLLQLTLRLTTDPVGANRQLASALMNMGEFGEAEKHYAAALQSEARESALYFTLLVEKAFCLERLGRYNEGLELLSTAQVGFRHLDAHEGLAYAHNTRGAIRWRLKEYNSALESFNLALEALGSQSPDPKTSRMFNNIGFTYYKMGQYQEARTYLLQSYRCDKKYDNINAMLVSEVNLGYVYAQTRRPWVGVAWATRALSVAIQTDNRFQQARAFDALGYCYESLKRRRKAIECWTKASEIFDSCRAPEAKEVAEKLSSIPVSDDI